MVDVNNITVPVDCTVIRTEFKCNDCEVFWVSETDDPLSDTEETIRTHARKRSHFSYDIGITITDTINEIETTVTVGSTDE